MPKPTHSQPSGICSEQDTACVRLHEDNACFGVLQTMCMHRDSVEARCACKICCRIHNRQLGTMHACVAAGKMTLTQSSA